MSTISRWALQVIALFLLGWVATVTANWSSSVASGTSNDRLAEVNIGALTTAKGSGLVQTRVQ
ncbi:hypothetical protein GIV19_06335 [Pseudomonas syringae]|uniref:hypothetical protein n=1 Tax=Pseudomonas syringae TaxID=317 RepID=UPI001F1F81D3|nr:hypothetical protein [Pseudomonas syringae]MCF5706907.1 hypothetical protein [Pseudomonas syringae]